MSSLPWDPVSTGRGNFVLRRVKTFSGEAEDLGQFVYNRTRF